MHALASKNAHIPFRDSKLTQLLQARWQGRQLQAGGREARLQGRGLQPSAGTTQGKPPSHMLTSLLLGPLVSQLVQDSLSGQAKTMMFMHVAPEVGGRG